MLELPGTGFKAAITKMLQQAITNSLEISLKIENLYDTIEVIKITKWKLWNKKSD